MAVELNARLASDQGLEKRFALDEVQPRNVLAINMQEIEGVIDEPNVALAVGRSLGLGEAWQSGVIDPTELAVKIGGLYVQLRERGDSAWIFLGPIEPGARQELHAAIVDPRGYAKAVQLDFVQPLRSPQAASRPAA